MTFQITKRDWYDNGAPTVPRYSWKLVKADGDVICESRHSFASEAECRSHIASAKKSMAGAGRCKVVSP